MSVSSYFLDYFRFTENVDNYHAVLKCLKEHRPFSDQGANPQDLISHINSCLGSHTDRLKGLCLLWQLVQQTTAEDFREQSPTWVKLILPIVQQAHERTACLILCCEVLAELLQRASSCAELSREWATSLLPQLLPALLSADQQWVFGSLRCLRVIMKCFPGPCGLLLNRLEPFVVTHLEDSETGIAQLACQCFALLAQCGGSGDKGIKHTESWSLYTSRVQSSLWNTLQQLFADIHPVDAPAITTRTIQMKAVSSVEPDRSLSLQSRFTTLCRCMTYLLSEDFPAVAKIPQKDILGIICAALSLTPKHLTLRGGQERLCLLAVLPELQSSCYSLLSSLILCCRRLMLPHLQVVNRLFVQALNWTNSGSSANKPYSALRQNVYATMTVWLKVMGVSCLTAESSDLIVHCIADATPTTNTIKIQTKPSTSHERPPTKKRKRRHGYTDANQIPKNTLLDANSDLCCAALEGAYQLVLNCGTFLKTRDHKLLHEFVIRTLVELQNSGESIHAPYSVPLCRRALYRLLQACVLRAQRNAPPPIHHAVRLFSRGQNDQDLQVSSVCLEGLAVCEAIIHPRAPSLQVPSSLSEETRSRAMDTIVEQNTLFTTETLFTTSLPVRVSDVTELNVPQSRATENRPSLYLDNSEVVFESQPSESRTALPEEELRGESDKMDIVEVSPEITTKSSTSFQENDQNETYRPVVSSDVQTISEDSLDKSVYDQNIVNPESRDDIKKYKDDIEGGEIQDANGTTETDKTMDDMLGSFVDIEADG